MYGSTAREFLSSSALWRMVRQSTSCCKNCRECLAVARSPLKGLLPKQDYAHQPKSIVAAMEAAAYRLTSTTWQIHSRRSGLLIRTYRLVLTGQGHIGWF